MKKASILGFLFFFILIGLNSCSKSETDSRDNFLGTWKGTRNIKFPTLGIDDTESATQTITKSASSSNQISIDGTLATVNGNTYTFATFSESFDDATLGTVTATFEGNGVLSGTSVAESGTVKMVILGVTYNGTWSSSLTKQ